MTNANIKQGAFLKNGYNRYFHIKGMDNLQTVLAEYNGHGPTGRTSVMSTSTFNALLRNKNWISVRYAFAPALNRWQEPAAAAESVAAIGGTRFLVKPAKFSLR